MLNLTTFLTIWSMISDWSDIHVYENIVGEMNGQETADERRRNAIALFIEISIRSRGFRA